MEGQKAADSDRPHWARPKLKEFDIEDITGGKPTYFTYEYNIAIGPS